MLDWLMAPFNKLLDWFYYESYDFVVKGFAYMVEEATIASIKFMAWATAFAWDVAKQVIEDIGLSAAIASAWSTIPGDTASLLSFFAIPDFINIVLTAFVTRYVLRFIPGTGY